MSISALPTHAFFQIPRNLTERNYLDETRSKKPLVNLAKKRAKARQAANIIIAEIGIEDSHVILQRKAKHMVEIMGIVSNHLVQIGWINSFGVVQLRGSVEVLRLSPRSKLLLNDI